MSVNTDFNEYCYLNKRQKDFYHPIISQIEKKSESKEVDVKRDFDASAILHDLSKVPNTTSKPYLYKDSNGYYRLGVEENGLARSLGIKSCKLRKLRIEERRVHSLEIIQGVVHSVVQQLMHSKRSDPFLLCCDLIQEAIRGAKKLQKCYEFHQNPCKMRKYDFLSVVAPCLAKKYKRKHTRKWVSVTRLVSDLHALRVQVNEKQKARDQRLMQFAKKSSQPVIDRTGKALGQFLKNMKATMKATLCKEEPKQAFSGKQFEENQDPIRDYVIINVPIRGTNNTYRIPH